MTTVLGNHSLHVTNTNKPEILSFQLYFFIMKISYQPTGKFMIYVLSERP